MHWHSWPLMTGRQGWRSTLVALYSTSSRCSLASVRLVQTCSVALTICRHRACGEEPCDQSMLLQRPPPRPVMSGHAVGTVQLKDEQHNAEDAEGVCRDERRTRELSRSLKIDEMVCVCWRLALLSELPSIPERHDSKCRTTPSCVVSVSLLES